MDVRAKSRKRNYSNSSSSSSRNDKTSDFSYGIKTRIPPMVYEWTEQHLDEIGITYTGNAFASPHDVLDNTNNPLICKLCDLPKEVNNAVKYLTDSIDFEINTDTKGGIDLGDCRYREATRITDALNSLSEKLQSNKSRLQDEISRDKVIEIYAFAQQFTRQLKNLLLLIFKNEVVNEKALYTDILKTFGEMCNLAAESGNALKRGLCVGKIYATAEPGIRFRSQKSMDLMDESETVVSIAEVKQCSASVVKNTSTRCRGKSEDSSSSDGSDFDIRSFLTSSVMGQHGGELLAEWKYSITNPCVIGMILCGSKIILTSLILKKEEYDEIYRNGKLEETKTVPINYSIPFDMFHTADRKILIEVFFRLAETHWT